MFVYIIGFIASILLIYYAESNHFRTVESKVCVFVALTIPCLIAGLRAHSVGTDVRVYVEPLFEIARSSESFWDFYRTEFYQNATWSYVFVYEFEPGFDVLCYICAKLFNSTPLFLLSIQALTVIPIYKGLMAFRKTQPVWLGMLVYYLMFYNYSLNVMRQWIAMAFLFYGFQFLVSKKHGKYFLTVLFAMLFHVSAVFGMVIYLVFRLTENETLYNNKKNTFLLVFVGIVLLLSLDMIAAVMERIGLRYANYISGSLSLMPRQVLYRIPIILLMILRWKYLSNSNGLAHFYIVMIAYDLIASQLVSIFAHSARIGTYFSEYYMLAYPAICRASSSPKNRQALRWFVVCYLCFYWWYVYIYSGSSATVPYVSVWG